MKAIVWEHMCGMLSLLFDVFDVFVVLEVVWNSFMLLCTGFEYLQFKCVDRSCLWCIKVCIMWKSLCGIMCVI